MSERFSRNRTGLSRAASESGDHANVRWPPPVIHLAAVLIAFGADRWLPLPLPARGISMALGAALVFVSFLLARFAFRQFSRHANPVPPNRPVNDLMLDGPFRFTRNPLYLALALLQAGVGLIAGNAWILLMLAPALLYVRFFVIAREEAYLARRFGQSYLDYQARVRRWF